MVEVVVAAGAVDVAAASLLEVLPREKNGVEDEAGAAVVVEDVVSAEDLLPKVPKRLDEGLEVSVVADVGAAEDAPTFSEPKRFELGAEVVVVEEPPPNRDGADGALVVAVPKAGVTAAWEEVGVGEVNEKVGVAWGADEAGVVPNKDAGLEVLPSTRLPMVKADPGAVPVVADVNVWAVVASEAGFPKLPNGLVPAD